MALEAAISLPRLFCNFAARGWLNRRNNRKASIMWKKLCLIALAAFAFGFASARPSNAGTEMLTDDSAAAPTDNYAPRPVYYAPPPVRVVVYPGYAHYAPFPVYGYRRVYGRN